MPRSRKPRLYRENQHRFRRWHDQIAYLDVDDCKSFTEAVQALRTIPYAKRPHILRQAIHTHKQTNKHTHTHKINTCTTHTPIRTLAPNPEL
eukprot:3173401-Amphidinium_carterae.1